jgi:hypothetical protein
MMAMTTDKLRREIKKVIDRLPAKQLASLADYIRFLDQAPLKERLEQAEKDFAAGKRVNWRTVRRDV